MGFVIPTRQHADLLFELNRSVAAGESVQLPIREVDGYAKINFLAVSAQAFSILVEEASAPNKPFVQTALLASSVDPLSGLSAVATFVIPVGAYMRVTVQGGSGTALIIFTGYGLPEAGGGGGGSGTSGFSGFSGFSGASGGGTSATAFEARLDTTDGVSNTLTLLPYKGNIVVVNGQTVIVPGAGLTRNIADNLIDAAGGDAGAPPAANTLYYVYISNASATFSPTSIRLSATAPTLVNGVRYLGNAGNALNWRFVGWVRPNATPQFESTLTSRTIVNYYNREELTIFTCPNYLDDGAATFYSCSNPSTWGAIDADQGGLNSTLTYIANGEDAQSFSAVAAVSNTLNRSGAVGIGLDTLTTAVVSMRMQAAQVDNLTGTLDYDNVATEGVHTVSLLGLMTTTNFMNVQADDDRFGGTKDSFATYLTGTLFG